MEKMLNLLLHLTKISRERHYYLRIQFFIFFYYDCHFLVHRQNGLFPHGFIQHVFFISFSYCTTRTIHYNLFFVNYKIIILNFKHFNVVRNIVDLKLKISFNYFEIIHPEIDNANNFTHMYYASFEVEARIGSCCCYYNYFIFSRKMKIVFLNFLIIPSFSNQYFMQSSMEIQSIIN
jgi:hypothetical protein